MNKTVISGAVAVLLAAPAMAQNAGTTLDQLQQEVNRLQSEVEYLKENAKAERKDLANNAVTTDGIKTSIATLSKFTWSGDLRYRNEQIATVPNTTTPEHTQGRDRIRLRFGVTVKVNDTINARLQLATSGGNSPTDPRSTNQTLTEGWSRKTIGVDLAYVDWKALSVLNVQLGKMPQPWTRTASYFWDGDLTPEGAALKFSRGIFFANAYYDWLNERYTADSGTTNNAPGRSDSKLIGAQAGIKQPIGKSTLTAAVGYFELTNVKDEITATATGCTPNSLFFNNSTNGNTTYTGGGCTRLLSEFKLINALAQFDFNAGKFPMSVFVDYMKNNDAAVNPVANQKLDTAMSAGLTFNKASAAKSWEIGYVYQKTEKDAVFGEFVDSDFGGGVTDVKGSVFKVAYVPATNWTLNGAYIVNKRFLDAPTSATTVDLKYKRLQLDLNYKF